MSEWVYLNGAVLPAAEAKISVFDAGLTHAAGLFETFRAYNGQVMRLEDHLRRLANSSATLELDLPVDEEAIAAGIADLLAANNLTEARLRLTLTPGTVTRPHEQPAQRPEPTVLIVASPVEGYPGELYRRGMRVRACPYRQNRLDPLAGHKTLAYLPRLLAIKEAADHGCQESLWFTIENQLAEGSMCNVFIVRDRQILTPPVDTPILPGTVRKAVIELAVANDIPLEEQPIDINALLAASEVFLTGSVLEIMPVTAIEKHTVGDGTPGPTTQRMSGHYKELIARECGT